MSYVSCFVLLAFIDSVLSLRILFSQKKKKKRKREREKGKEGPEWEDVCMYVLYLSTAFMYWVVCM